MMIAMIDWQTFLWLGIAIAGGLYLIDAAGWIVGLSDTVAATTEQTPSKIDRIYELLDVMAVTRDAIDATTPDSFAESLRLEDMKRLVAEFVSLHDYPIRSYAAELLCQVGWDGREYHATLRQIMQHNYGQRESV